MKDPTFISLVEVMDIHHDSLARYGGQSGIRDLGLLESALGIPMASFGGSFLHGDVFEMAAAYAYHIAENQPFIDGNKRTALGAALGFLDSNGIELLEKNNEFYEAMILIGTRKMTKMQVADLFRGPTFRKKLFLTFAFPILWLHAAEPPLSDRLLSSVGEVREDAVTEFNQLPHETQERFIPTLMVGLSSDDPEVHDQAAALLKQLDAAPAAPKDEVAAAPLETPVERKTREEESLEEIQQVKTDRYKKLQTELEAEKQAQAQSPSLEDAQEDKKTDPIRDALLDGVTDPTPFVRSRSARRLAGLQPPMVEAIPALTKMLNDSDAECRASAAGALGAFGPIARDAIPQLEKLTGDADPNVHAIAQDALHQVRGE